MSDDVCRDLELLLEHAFIPTKVFNVGGRHEVMHVFPRATRNPQLQNRSVEHFCQFLAADFVPYTAAGSSPHIPSSSSLSSTNTDDELGVLQYARAASFAMMFLMYPFLGFPVAALLTLYLSISMERVDEKRFQSVYLLNSF